ncbi:MAG: dockerin type I repeat-containing protein [Clostridia bacterium]|nr:dockerin type I repeat-containing protein [Clostridia bacterium]
MKKIISILACVCLLLSVMIIPVSAASDSVTYTFSDYKENVAVTDYSKALDDIITVGLYGTTNSGSGNFHDQLRIYQGAYAVISSTKDIESIVINLGYKNSTYDVFTSDDGTTWNSLSSSVAYTQAYADHTITLTTPAKYIKLAGGAQMRIKTMTVNFAAAEEEVFVGTDPEAPIELAVNEATPAILTEIKVPAEGTVYVKAADANGIFHVTSTTGACTLINGMTNQVEISDAYDLTLCGYEMVNIYNAGAETVTLYVFLEAGAGEVAGTWENPEVLELQANPMMPQFPPSANAETALEEGNQGYFYKIVATEDGAFAVNVSAVDAEYSSIGYQFNVTNNTTSWQSDLIARAVDADDYYDTLLVPVAAGDEIIINAGTYNPEDVWNAPAGTLNVRVGFTAVGSYEYPEVLELQANPMMPQFPPSANAETALEEGNQGYFYKIVATEDGAFAVNVSAIDAEYNSVGYQFNVTNNTTSWQSDLIARAADAEDYYDTLMVPVAAGDEVIINAGTYNPEDAWNAPEGTLNVRVGFATVGSYEYPEVLELEENPWMPQFPPSANAETVLEEGNQGYYYEIVATEDGAFIVNVSAHDGEWNSIGYQFNVTNSTTYWQSDYVARAVDADDYYDSLLVPVNAGDVIVINAGTFDPENPWTAPAGILNVSINFASVGSYEYPVILETSTELEEEIEEGSQGYYYQWVATEDSIVTVTMNDEAGWMYGVNKIPVDTEDYDAYYYGDTHWYDDETVVSSEAIKVYAGETVTVFVNTYDPENPWTAPAGTVNWSFDVEAITLGDADGDGEFNAKDYTTLMQYLNEWDGVVVDELAADVNGDGKLNGRDCALMLQYFNDWDVEIK